jgi:hypothetical protein
MALAERTWSLLGRLLCPRNDREGCQLSVWSTPKNPQNHANAIMRAVGRCAHSHGA